MSDDIDIEEHDVMVGVAGKNVFVDLSIVKQEVIDVEYEEEHITDAVLPPPSPKIVTTCSVEVNNADSTTDDLPEHPPTSVILDAVSSSQNDDATETDLHCNDSDVDHEKLRAEALNSTTEVALKDWGSYLSECKCYCENCQILFPTENVLAAHNMSVHSYLVAVEPNASTPTTPVMLDATFYCQETGVIVWDKLLLRLQGNAHKCLICNKIFTLRTSARRHCLNQHQIKNWFGVESDSESNVSISSKDARNSQSSYYQYENREDVRVDEYQSPSVNQDRPSTSNTCQLCGQQFMNKDLLLNHLYEKHFPTKMFHCKYCDSNFYSESLLQKHPCVENTKMLEKEIPVIKSESINATKNVGFRCNICFCYYLTEIHILLHMSDYHKRIVDKVPPEFAVDEIKLMCPFCSSRFMYITSYNKHIKTKHPEKVSALLPDKDFRPELIVKNEGMEQMVPLQKIQLEKEDFARPKKVLKVNNGFKCGICFKCFPTYNQTYKHRVRHHANVKKNAVLKNTRKITSYMPTIENSKSGTVLLPKDIIFKCPKCKIYSTSITDAEYHFEKHDFDIDCMNTKKCEICDLHFTITSIKNHRKQHQFCQQFSKITVENTDTFKGRVLHKCPKCSVHFSEIALKRHYFICGNGTPKTNCVCTKCNITIDNKSYFYHQKCHELNLNIIISVNYSCIEEVKKDTGKRWKFFYCKRCKCYVTNTEARFSIHKTGKCLKFDRDVCQECGLMLPVPALTYHHKIHGEINGVTFKNYDFYNNSGGPPGKIYPPAPVFPLCQKCGIHFESIASKSAHICSKTSCVICEYCNIKLTKRAKDLHLNYHNYMGKTKSPENVIPSREFLTEAQKSKILFLCTSCNVIVDDYDDLVRHCQEKLTNVPKSTMLCDVCDLNFDELCYDRHMKIHVKRDISRDYFTILEYDEEEFLKPSWLILFYLKNGKKNSTRLEKVIKESVYKNIKYCKLQAPESAKSNRILYQCATCECVVNHSQVFRHMKLYVNGGGCRKMKCKSVCKICNLKFMGWLNLRLHLKKFNHREKNYVFVKFNSREDRYFNNRLLKFNNNYVATDDLTKDKRSVDAIIDKDSGEYTEEKAMVYAEDESKAEGDKRNVVKSTSKYKMYVCSECKISMSQKHSCLRHVKQQCTPPVLKRMKCKLCGLLIFKSRLYLHEELHKKFPDFKKGNFEVIFFGKSGRDVTFSNADSSTNSMSKLRAIPESDKLKISAMSEPAVKKFVFYQCKNCRICVASSQNAKKHKTSVYNCKDMKKKLMKCPICGLMFYQSLNSHMQLHDIHRDMNRKTIKVIPFGDHNDTEDSDDDCDEAKKIVQVCDSAVTEEEKKYVLYKCLVCDVCVEKQRSAKVHEKYNRHISDSAFRKCELCNLKFSIKGWPSHQLRHQMYDDYLPENIKVVEFGLNIDPCDEVTKVDSEEDASRCETDVDSQASVNVYKLYKCVECGTHLHSKRSISKHVHSSMSRRFKKCKLCNLKFASKSLKHHMEVHTDPNYTRDNIELIQFSNGSIIKSEPVDMKKGEHKVKVSAKLPNIMKSEPEDIKKDEPKAKVSTDIPKKHKYVVYKCSECDICFNSNRNQVNHSGNGFHQPSNKVKCRRCGLNFAARSYIIHEALHKKHRDYTKNNIKVVELSKKSIDKSINGDSDNIETTKKYLLFQCARCDLYMNSRDNVRHHYEYNHLVAHGCQNCELCDYKFTKRGWRIHQKMHADFENYNKDNIKIVKIYRDSVNGQLIDVDEEIEKCATSTKYVLYKCRQCKMCLDCMDSAAMHTATNLHIDDPDMAYCNYCKCGFSQKNLKSHIALHETKKDYIIDNIQFVEFGELHGSGQSTKHIDNAEKDEDFEVKSKEDCNDTFLTDRLLIYKCRRCNICFSKEKSAVCHEDKGHPKVNTDVCKLCGLVFSLRALKYHQRHHVENITLNRSNMEVIEFGEKTDHIEGSLDYDTFANDSTEVNKFSFSMHILYRCQKCEVCFHSTKGANKHMKMNTCSPDNETTICELCGYKFSNSSFAHKQKHKIHKMNRENIKITDFSRTSPVSSDRQHSEDVKNETIKIENRKRQYDGNLTNPKKNDQEERDAKLFKCSCGLHFLTETSIEKHSNVCQTDKRSITRQNCSRCGLEFTAESLFSHLCTHHGNNKYKYNYEIIEMPPSKRKEQVFLYRCVICDIHFLVSSSARKHTRTCRGLEPHKVSRCDKCGLKFFKKMIIDHNTYHHTMPESFIEYEFKIIDIMENVDVPETVNEKTVLYKCATCCIHFMKKPSIDEHVRIPHRTKINIKSADCDICHLTFTSRAMPIHKKMHHENDPVVEFEIHEYDSLSKMEVAMRRHRVAQDADNTNDDNETLNASKSKGALDGTHAEELRLKAHKKTVTRILYKCSECKVHYLKESTVYKHVIKNHQKIHPSDIFECKYCGLSFRALTLTPHTRQHHFDNKFELKDFTIHEYEPVTRQTILKSKNLQPKIIIYNATDGRENLQTEEEVDGLRENIKSIDSSKKNDEKLLEKKDGVVSLDVEESESFEKGNNGRAERLIFKIKDKISEGSTSGWSNEEEMGTGMSSDCNTAKIENIEDKETIQSDRTTLAAEPENPNRIRSIIDCIEFES